MLLFELMKKIFPFFISLSVGAVLFAWIIKFVGFNKIKEASSVFTGWQGLLILGLTVIMALIGTFKWKEILRGEGVEISFKKLFGPYLSGYAVMLLAPIMLCGGEVLRGYFLKEKYSVSWVKGMASVVIDRIFEWTVNLIVILFGTAFFITRIHLIPNNLEIIFGIVLLLFAAAILYFYLKVWKKESIIEAGANIFGLKRIEEKNTFLETEKEIFNFFKIKNRLMWKVFYISFLRAGVMLLRVWVLIFFLEKTVAWVSGISILGFNYLAVMIPIPAALGSHEAIQIFAFEALGMDNSNATVFAMVIRGAEITMSLAGIVFLFKYGVEFSKKLFFKKIEKISDKN
jgi:uncharacterized protein (TIRG00374 family)